MSKLSRLVVVVTGLWLVGAGVLRAAPCAFQIERHERRVPTSLKKQMFAEAKIPWKERGGFVVDHIVPLRLGGTNDRANLQIQTVQDARWKDVIEGHLHRCVCGGYTTPEVAVVQVQTAWRRVRVDKPCPTTVTESLWGQD